MLRQHQRFYYALKPFLPWSLRMGLRRIAAQHTLKRNLATWPINPAAAELPAGWPGWPDGKKFAVVLTHDVEGIAGLSKCEALLKLERAHGFRSSFNFIPEGDYRVSKPLRQFIADHGCEVGVHDLRHDGKLFRSHREFQRSAAQINKYIREWGASGYRSGFMLRNLDWLHSLDVQYDSSTFDTDPFELQPEGMGTIFPFWLPSHRSSPHKEAGYVELPYTLPQDSTLFLVLQQNSPATWLEKVDWIAEHGGMVLVNVHPDYLQFDGQPDSTKTYPAEFYSQLLEHIKTKYAGQYWHALPREVAGFVARLPQRPRVRRPRRVCMVTHSFYESDNRVTRYAEALAARGDHVDVLALRRSPNIPEEEVIEGVNVFRLQNRYGKKEQSELSYFWPLIRFLLVTSAWITRRNVRQKYDVLHIHNMPDFLVFAAWQPKLAGAPILLDIHDIVPEFYSSKFKSNDTSLTAMLIKRIERFSAQFVSHVIIANDLWLEKFQSRTGTRGRCTVFINNVDTRVFQRLPRTRQDDRQLIIFPGGLQWHQGLDIALQAFKIVSAKLPNAEFHIYGDGNMKPSLIRLAGELGFNGNVKFFEPVGVRQISRIMSEADLGVVPKRADSFGNEAYSTKIMEFMSLGIPVVVSRTKIDQYYFNESVVRFFDSGNVEKLAEAILDVLQNPALRQQLVDNALAYSDQNSWKRRKADYLTLVDRLIAGDAPQNN